MSLRRTLPAVLAAAALVTSGLAGMSITSGASAQSERSFLVPANDGYGIADCLAEGASCGKIVADAWCQAKGLGKAVGFGPVDPTDVTASVRTAQVATPAARSYTITCGE